MLHLPLFALLLLPIACAGVAHAGVPPTLGPCGSPATRVHEIQGRERSSPLAGTSGVIVEAVVVAVFPGLPEGLGGFFVQEEDADADLDPETSEGLFVFSADPIPGFDPQIGDGVRVRGQVQEFFGKTELSQLSAAILCPVVGTATATSLRFPVPVVDPSGPSFLERFEGMRVRVAEPLVVIEQYAAGRFGELGLAAGDRPRQPTQHIAPGPAAIAWLEDDERRQILLDDGQSSFAPDPWPYLFAFSGDTLRLGDAASELEGVLDFAFGRFRLQPIRAPRLDSQASSPPLPDVPGALRIVTWNVENLFNGDGLGGGFPTRGAASPFEYQRQRAKVAATLAALDADVLALVEVENDGVGVGSALRDLVEALRAFGLDYQPVEPVDAEVLGNHAIAVALLYRVTSMRRVGAAAVLDDQTDPSFDSGRNRPSLAQTFRHRASGESVTLIVNHFKSKGSSCESSGDPDLGDGQGNCNETRRRAAGALLDWALGDPTSTGAPVLILGDLNAYPLEDPVRLLTDAGFVDLIALFDSPDAYTFVFDGRAGRLDHALARAELADRVGGAAVWNINADESPALDYHEDNPAGLYRDDPRRASDHDPVIVGVFPELVPEPSSRVLGLTALVALLVVRRSGAERVFAAVEGHRARLG